MLHAITDWDDAYANGPNIAGGERWPAAWVAPAAQFRERLAAEGRARLDLAYGEAPRNRFDLFLPEGTPKGLVVFIHGGFWLRLDKSYWSHLAAGPLAHGFAVAMPSYTLCPDASIAAITQEMARATAAAAERVPGPIRLVGHSAGGHLVTRMVSHTSPLPEAIRTRIALTLSLSGLHDLRPLLNTGMNATIGLDAAMAAAESPALLAPLPGTRLICWVGGAERSEFLRQNALLANIWKGLGAATDVVEEPDRHHFNVIDGLANPDHPLCRALLSP
ncbi:MAG: alpha/beta hydrolase [Devosia sp.]